MPEDKPKSIDERLEALAMNLELLTTNVHDLQDSLHTMKEAHERMDARERQLREALLRGVAGFIRGLGNGEER